MKQNYFNTLDLKYAQYIHEEDLVHGNLKPENLIYETESEDSKIKISDVAVYELMDKDLLRHAINSSTQFCGNLNCKGFSFFEVLLTFLS